MGVIPLEDAVFEDSCSAHDTAGPWSAIVANLTVYKAWVGTAFDEDAAAVLNCVAAGYLGTDNQRRTGDVEPTPTLISEAIIEM